MEITQVKCLDAGTTIRYSEVNVNTPEHTELPQCPDRRDADFEAALTGVRKLGAKLLDQKVDDWTCTGVSVSKNGKGNRQFILTGVLKTKVGPTQCDVPKMHAAIDASKGQNILTQAQLDTIDKLLARAVDYVRGEREQLALPLGGGDDDAEGPTDAEADADAKGAAVTDSEPAGVS